jgi:pantetheine-phosphate adenylyltransferase
MAPPDNRTAICPGTFDPITNGHLDVIGRASAMFDLVIVGVVNHPWRKGQTLFTAEERVSFVEKATSNLGNIKVEPFSTLLVEFARERRAMAIVKGLRAISDFEYELEMNQLNRKQAPEIESVYLMASAKYSFLRSSGVKELATFGGDIAELVPEEVARALMERLRH